MAASLLSSVEMLSVFNGESSDTGAVVMFEKYIVTRRGDLWTGFGLDNWIYCTLYIHTVRDYRQYSSIDILHTFQFAVAHAVGFTVFTSRILPTDFHTVSLALQTTPKVFFASPNSFVGISVAGNSEVSTRLFRFKTAVLYSNFVSTVRVRVTLRLMISQSDCLGVEPHLGLMTRFFNYLFIFLKVTVLSISGDLSDERSGLSLCLYCRTKRFLKPFCTDPTENAVFYCH
jgi:hypothetical protein